MQKGQVSAKNLHYVHRWEQDMAGFPVGCGVSEQTVGIVLAADRKFCFCGGGDGQFRQFVKNGETVGQGLRLEAKLLRYGSESGGISQNVVAR